MERVSERLGTAVSPIGQTLSALTEALHTLDGRFKAQIAQFDGSIARLQGLVGHLERAGEQLRGAGTPIAETAKRFELAGNRIEEAGRAFSELQRRLSDLSAALEQSVAKNTVVWDEYQLRFSQADDQLAKVIKGLVEGAASYQKSVSEFVSQMDQNMANAILRFRGAIEELGEVASDLESLTSRDLPKSITKPLDTRPTRRRAGS